MTLTELHGRIHCWLWLYEHVPFPSSTDPYIIELNKRVNLQMKTEMMIDMVEWSVPSELIGSVIAQDLQMAIDIAILEDTSKINEIYSLLISIEQHLTQEYPVDPIKEAPPM